MSDAPDRLVAALADRYRIERALGSGGMATVYLAEDLKHDRKVAIKVLKPELAAVLGAERFVQEIKTTAALSHPHILPLFDSGEADGFLFYVMPYIQGETIRDRLNRETQFAVDEALRITREIADALDYAHRHGVVHRDIKPENLLLHDGRAMVMDFGIALAVSAAAGGRMTETGLSLGTPHYMSPEQATADKSITGRSDVYSLASVCYEMLTGVPPHDGGSAQQVIMRIIADTPRPMSDLRKTVPPHVTAAVAKALEKLPADRFESPKAFAEALGTVGFTHGTTAVTTAGAPSLSGRPGQRVIAALAAALVIAIGAAAAGWMRPQPEAPFRRLDLDLGQLAASDFDVTISPNGRMLAVDGRLNGVRGIYLRRLDGDAEFRLVDGTAGGIFPSFSPDNEWIVFRRTTDNNLVKVRVGGGGAITLTGANDADPFFPDWGADGRIAYVGLSGSGVISSDGTPLRRLPGNIGRRISLLPDGSGVLGSRGGNIVLHEFETDSIRTLVPGGRMPVYVPTGHLLYAGVEGGVFVVGFDLKQRRVLGAPIRILERAGTTVNARGFSLSATGLLVHRDSESQSSGAGHQLHIVNPGIGVDTVRIPPSRFARPRFAPDGQRIALEVLNEDRNGQSDIYVTDLVTGNLLQLTFEGDNDQPVWSPDGTQLAYDRVSERGGEEVCVKPADNSGPERCLGPVHSGEVEISAWLDDSTLLYAAESNADPAEIFTVGLRGDTTPRPFLRTPFAEWVPQVSPDRRFIVFESNETGSPQLWMRDYPTPQGKWNLSRTSFREPRWSPDGRYVYFWHGGSPVDSLLRVRIDRDRGVVVNAPEPVQAVDVDGPQNWDLHPDGRRYVITMRLARPTDGGTAAAATPERYLVLENFFSQIRALTAESRR